MQIQLDLMKKELIYKEKEDATFNEHQEVINQKQKEIDELAQKPKGLSGLFDKFDGETINVLAREIVPQLGKLISMGIDRLTGGAVPQAQYPAQPAPVQEVYNPDEYYEENVQQPQKPAYNPNLSGPGI